MVRAYELLYIFKDAIFTVLVVIIHRYGILVLENFYILKLSGERLNESDENISILGGEPLMQYSGLTALCKFIKEHSDKSIWLWSGYTLSHIQQHYPEILKWIDVIVDGPFIKELAEPNLRFRGSSNQQIVPISAKGIEEYNLL